MIRFIIQLFVTWIVGTALLLLASEILVESASAEDIFGFTSYSLVYFTGCILLLYLPGFTLLKRNGVNTIHFTWIAPVVLNLPLYILFYLLIDKAFRRSEAILFMCLFLFFGLAFGWIFHKYRKRLSVQH